MNENTPPEAPSEAEKVILAVESSAHTAVSKVLIYKRQAIVLAVVIVGFTLIYSLFSHWQQKTENAAWRKIFAAEVIARQQTKATSFGGEMQKASPEIAGAKARFYAHMLELASAGASENRAEWEKAALAAQKFIDDFSGNPFISQVRLDYAAVLTNLGAYDQAAEQYKAVMTAGNSEEKYSAQLFAALVQERTGKENEALDGYARLANEKTDFADVAAFARLRLEEKIRAKNPAASAPAASAPAASAPAASAPAASAPAASAPAKTAPAKQN